MTTLREMGADAGYPSPAGTPDLSREAAKAEYVSRVARLGDELEKMTRMVAFARECLENELFSGMGYKKLGISDRDVTKIKTLASALDSAVSAKIRYDKSAKEMAAAMTPEEEFDAVYKYLSTLGRDQLDKVHTYCVERKRYMAKVEMHKAADGPKK